MKNMFIALVLLLGAAGCNLLLPSGDAPQGDIVDDQVAKKLTEPEIQQTLGTLLTASALQYFPAGPVTLECPPSLRPMAQRAIEEARGVCGIHYEPAAAAILVGKEEEGKVCFSLYYFSRKLWGRSFIVKGKE